MDKIKSIKDCTQISEISLENNPIGSFDSYLQFLKDSFPELKTVDSKRVENLVQMLEEGMEEDGTDT